MVALNYRQLALRWRPGSERDHTFNIIALIAMMAALLFVLLMSSIPLPKQERVVRAQAPERVARFVRERPKPKPRAETKVEPAPALQPEPKIDRPPREERKPLTPAEERARQRVQDKGLAGLAGELAAIADASSISAMASQRVTAAGAGAEAATVDTRILTAAGGRRGGSGGPAQSLQAGATTETKLNDSRGQHAQGLLAAQARLGTGAVSEGSRAGARRGKGRAEEDVAIVMDKHKSMLYAIYNRARRSNPSLKGKIVLVLTILPSGQVAKIVVKSNELNAPELEASLLARIRQFDFGASEGGPFTVTVPVEFLPS